MARFKPFRGSRSALDATPTQDGNVYFCTDDGSLHFDYVDADGNLHRKQINAKNAETLCGMTLDEIRQSCSTFVQADWNQTDETQNDYIKNKPDILTEEDVIKLIEDNGGGGTVIVETDKTLTKADVAADAMAVGNRLGGLTFSVNENGIVSVSIDD
jgi:hypothetical protein